MKLSTASVFWKADLLTCFQSNKKHNDCEVWRLKPSQFLSCKENCDTRKWPVKFWGFRETGPREGTEPMTWPVVLRTELQAQIWAGWGKLRFSFCGSENVTSKKKIKVPYLKNVPLVWNFNTCLFCFSYHFCNANDIVPVLVAVSAPFIEITSWKLFCLSDKVWTSVSYGH